jgi:hypothetical protein
MSQEIEKKVEELAVRVARKLRIKTHDMREDHEIPACRASNGSNAKWLDATAKEDAPIVVSALREAMAHAYRDAAQAIDGYRGDTLYCSRTELVHLLERKALEVSDEG